jgi:hypothetical protein
MCQIAAKWVSHYLNEVQQWMQPLRRKQFANRDDILTAVWHMVVQINMWWWWWWRRRQRQLLWQRLPSRLLAMNHNLGDYFEGC